MKVNKFMIGGLFILAAVVFLVVSSSQANSEYFMTVDELNVKGASVMGKSLRVSGAIIGDTIQYDPATLTLTFEVANVPGDNRDAALRAARVWMQLLGPSLAFALDEATV